MKRIAASRSRLFRAALVLVALVVVAPACSAETLPLDPEVARLFDIDNNLIADLTPDDGAETVPLDVLRRAALQAQEQGTDLRVVVAAPDGQFIPAKAVVDRYGGTAISYQADRTGFEGASSDMTAAQLNRSIDAAKVQVDIGDSATAFVDVIANEGLDKKGRGLGAAALYAALAVAALFMLWNAWSFMQARTRREKRQASFVERKRVLTEWAAMLGPEVTSLQPMVAGADDASKQTWHEANDFVSTISSKLDEATGAGELDVAEMRIGRTAIKLRDLRRSLEG